MTSKPPFFSKKIKGNASQNRINYMTGLPNPANKTEKSANKTEKSDYMTAEYQEKIRINSYLGKKGYTIPKEVLLKADLDFLYQDLFCKPATFGPGFGPATEEVAFPVYRENTKKLYIPRFYGIARYGQPPNSEIEPGSAISVPFVKELRDYQNEIIDVYMKHISSSSGLASNGGGILEVECGRGKTVMALKIASLVQKKTLIIVHKEFLMNQWIDRIAEFLPSAKVGKIQGPTFEVEGRDIVIGMLQTLYDRDFPADAFNSFGLTIIDEVHRIGSEQFSKALLRIITPYMLGISATVERKDKLTKILYMFIGPKIYSSSRKADDPVCVRAIEYISPDEDFNEIIRDYRGNTQYSSMITKICAFGPRCDFLVRIVGDLVKESPESQIMILAHNRSLLTYLFEAINHHAIAPVGFYVGGMKQKNLQETETKQIVLATYAMAAEALDIKTLSTLMMVTPKTDIV